MVRFCCKSHLVKESGHTPTLPCLAYKQKWPPKKDDHSCCGKLFGAAGVFRATKTLATQFAPKPSHCQQGGTCPISSINYAVVSHDATYHCFVEKFVKPLGKPTISTGLGRPNSGHALCFFELARVVLRFDYVACIIVNANHSIM